MFKMKLFNFAATMVGTYAGIQYLGNQDMMYAYAAAGLLTLGFVCNLFTR